MARKTGNFCDDGFGVRMGSYIWVQRVKVLVVFLGIWRIFLEKFLAAHRGTVEVTLEVILDQLRWRIS
jgi:hypothetical protein